MAEAIIRTENLEKTFAAGGAGLTVFRGIDFEAHAGESIALTGESGSGKSTLLHILGALDRPTAGKVFFQGKALSSLSADELAAYRNSGVGYVWQNYCLLPEFTAQENVEMPLRIRGVEDFARPARRWIERVGLTARATNQPGELSGGEQQRIAIARALVGGPRVLLADEPTGNLDARSGAGIMEILLELSRREGLAAIIATHNTDFASRCDRVLRFDCGRLKAAPRSGTAGVRG